MDLLNYNILFS